MPQHDRVIDNQTFPATRADLNSLFAAIRSLNSGATEPLDTAPGMLWTDTTTQTLKQRNLSDSKWHVIGSLQDNKVLEKNGAYTVELKDSGCFIVVNASTAFDIALPPAVGVGKNFRVSFKRVDDTGSAVSVVAVGSDKIDGETRRLLELQYESFDLVSDGNNQWYVAAATSQMLDGISKVKKVTELPVSPEPTTLYVGDSDIYFGANGVTGGKATSAEIGEGQNDVSFMTPQRSNGLLEWRRRPSISGVHREPHGVPGGAFTGGGWEKRELTGSFEDNHWIYDGFRLGQMRLKTPGLYHFEGGAIAHNVGKTKLGIWDKNFGHFIATGPLFCADTFDSSVYCSISGVFPVFNATEIELHQFAERSGDSTAKGIPTNARPSSEESYAHLDVYRICDVQPLLWRLTFSKANPNDVVSYYKVVPLAAAQSASSSTGGSSHLTGFLDALSALAGGSLAALSGANRFEVSSGGSGGVQAINEVPWANDPSAALAAEWIVWDGPRPAGFHIHRHPNSSDDAVQLHRSDDSGASWHLVDQWYVGAEWPESESDVVVDATLAAPPLSGVQTWRILGTAPKGISVWSVDLFDQNDATGESVLATNISASSEYGAGHEAALAFDQNPNTRWTSVLKNGEQWLKWDSAPFSSFSLRQYVSSYQFFGAKLQRMEAGGGWTDVVSLPEERDMTVNTGISIA